MKKEKRLKLRPVWCVVLTIAAGCVLGLILIAWLKDINDKANKCQKINGHACTYYEIRQTMIHK